MKLRIDPLEELLVARAIVIGAPRRIRTIEQAREQAKSDAAMIRARLAAAVRR